MNDDTPHGVVLSNSKEELFAQEVASGASQTAAYRKHYDASSMQANSVHSEAYKIRHKPEIAMRIDELKAKAADVAIVDKAMVLRGLLTEAENTEEGASHSARVAAWAHLGKHLNMFIDKVDHTTNGKEIKSGLGHFYGRDNDDGDSDT